MIINSIKSRLLLFFRKKLGVISAEEKLEYQEKQIRELQIALIRATTKEYQDEVNYLQEKGLSIFPYDKIDEVSKVESGFDKQFNLPYVLHKGKRLYFPHVFSIEQCIMAYSSYIGEECILGGKYKKKQPHQYMTDNFKVEKGDVLVDVGCAEALLSLDNVEIASKIFLFEAEPMWIPALKATFKDYMDKVVLCNKYVSGVDSDATITLETALKNERNSNLFIKMDIEGAEVDVLSGSKEFLSTRRNVKIACCTYHRQNDQIVIPSIVKEMGYSYEFSEGYMLFLYDPNLQYPYLRRGIIRARNY